TEGLARLCVVYGLVEQPLHGAEMSANEASPFPFHALVEDWTAAADGANSRRFRHTNVIEHKLADRAGAQTHFLEGLSAAESRRATLHQERRNAAHEALIGVRA